MEEDRGREGEGDVGDGVAIDSDVVGRRAGGHAVELHGAPLAVVAGEGEDGDFVEGGGEGGRGGGHGVGVAAAEAGVALDGLGLGAVAPLGEVAALGGRGGDAQLGAGQDAVGVSLGAGGHAVGEHGAGAGLAVDGPIVDSSPCKFAMIIAAVFEGTADADSDRMGVLADFAHASADLVVCIGIVDIVIIAEGGVVGQAAGGDGNSPAVFGTAQMFEGEGVDGANALGNLNAALAAGGEGEQGVLGEGGGEGHSLVHRDGVGVGGVVLWLAVVAPGADVVAVLGLGHDLHRGAGDDEVLALGGGGDDVGAAAADEGYLFDISGAAFDDDLVSVTFPHGGVGVDGPALGVVPVGVVIIACESHLDAAEVAVLAGEGETT